MAVVAAALVCALVTFAYLNAGWHRMDRACTLDATAPAGASLATVELGWSWAPPGFACTWDGTDGQSVTVVKLWW